MLIDVRETPSWLGCLLVRVKSLLLLLLWHLLRLLLRVVRGVLGLDATRQAQGFDNDFALDVRAGHFEVLSDVEPDWFDFLGGELNQVLEAQHVVGILQRERLRDIFELDVLDIRVLLGQDEDITVRVLHLVVILHEVFADDRHFASGCGHIQQFFTFKK